VTRALAKRGPLALHAEHLAMHALILRCAQHPKSCRGMWRAPTYVWAAPNILQYMHPACCACSDARHAATYDLHGDTCFACNGVFEILFYESHCVTTNHQESKQMGEAAYCPLQASPEEKRIGFACTAKHHARNAEHRVESREPFATCVLATSRSLNCVVLPPGTYKMTYAGTRVTTASEMMRK